MKTQLSQNQKTLWKKRDDEEVSWAESQAAAVPSPPAWEPGDGPDLCPHLGEGWNSLPAGAATLDRWKHCFQARATTTTKCTTLYIQGNHLLDFSPNISRGCAHKGLDEPGHLSVMPGVLPRSEAEGCWELQEIPCGVNSVTQYCCVGVELWNVLPKLLQKNNKRRERRKGYNPHNDPIKMRTSSTNFLKPLF